MNMSAFLRYLAIEPVRLSLKEKSIVTLACFVAILFTATATRFFAAEHSAILVASMGASAAILFAIPGSPLAQPWPLLGGQILSAAIGIFCAAFIDNLSLAAALAAGLSVLAMLALRCLHPPGAATALAPVLNGVHSSAPDLDFLLYTVGINVMSMFILAVLINRVLLGRDYPQRLSVASPAKPLKRQDRWPDISQADIEQATRGLEHFVDIGTDELLQIYSNLQSQAFQKHFGAITCGEIMERDVVTVEYATEVEAAWLLMHERQLKAMPVLDKARRVIGMVTRYDFLKNLKLTPYRSFQEKWLAFLKPSDEVYTDKPEAIGHIMVRKVKTLSATDHVAALIPLIINDGHHQLPIVDEERRFVGMVYQSRLLSVLFTHYSRTVGEN